MTAAKPDSSDLVAWLGLQSTPDDRKMAVYAECVETAIDWVESRVTLPDGTTDDDYPQRLRMAELILASRLAKRPGSPEGVAGLPDLGAVVSILGRDPDVEGLLYRFRTFGFA